MFHRFYAFVMLLSEMFYVYPMDCVTARELGQIGVVEMAQALAAAAKNVWNCFFL